MKTDGGSLTTVSTICVPCRNERIAQIIDRAITYLRRVLGTHDYTPFSFRAGNWLFQPTQPAANILAERGVKVDSSVFKGGMRHQHNLNYCQALKNGYYWKFTEKVDVPATEGTMLEMPIYTQMVPFWQILTTKRIEMEEKGAATDQSGSKKLLQGVGFSAFQAPAEARLLPHVDGANSPGCWKKSSGKTGRTLQRSGLLWQSGTRRN